MAAKNIRGAWAGAFLALALVLTATSCVGNGAGVQAGEDESTPEMSASEASLEAAEEAERLREEELSRAPSDAAYEAQAAAEDVLRAVAAKDADVTEPYLAAAYFDPSVVGLTYEEFVSGFFDGFSYELASLRDMQDGSVEVAVYLDTRDGREALTALGDVYREAYDAGNTAVMATYAAAVWPEVQRVRYRESYTLYLVNDGEEGWVVEDAASFGAALLGGYDLRQED